MIAPLETENRRVGANLARLRANAGVKQARIAEIVNVDTSRISRIETGDLLPTTEEIVQIADAINTAEAKDYITHHQSIWIALEKPPFWHPSRHELAAAERHLARLDVFVSKPQTGESAKAQAHLHRQTLIAASDYLRALDHSIAFVGEIGVGKSTAICGITELLLSPEPKGPVALSKRVVLETGSGRTTLCEVQVRSEGRNSYGLVIHAHSPEEVFRTVSDFCDSLLDAVPGRSGRGGNDGESRGVSEELNKALRNMAGLARRMEEGPDGKSVRFDPAMELALKCNGNSTEFIAEVLKRIRLEQRTRTEFRFEEADMSAGLRRLRELFASVNKGLAPEVSLPRRLDLVVPFPLLGDRAIAVQIIDTKGVDDTAIRPDIRAYLDDPRTLTVLCSRFNTAPDTTMRQLMESVASTGAERILSERVVVLVLARAQEVLETQDDVGSRAETAEEGYRIKNDQIRWALSNVKGTKELPVVFFDVLNDDHRAIADQLAGFVEGMRGLQAQRVVEVGKAVEELIKRHDETQTKQAQETVRRRLRIFIEQHRYLRPATQKVYEPFISAVESTHARTVWATTRRNGSWPGLDAYHLLGVGTAIGAQTRSHPLFSGLDELLGNMLGDDELEPARDYLQELRRTVPVWRETFLQEATASGREMFRAELFSDDKVWDECVSFWGTGQGYRNRVARQLDGWCVANSQLESAVEKRVQSAWVDCFLTPLASLCDSSDLLTHSSPELAGRNVENVTPSAAS